MKNEELLEKEKNEYPDETGYYLARFPSGTIRRAFFTRVSKRTQSYGPYGRWGDRNPMDSGYIPLRDPCNWQKIDKEIGEK